MPKHSQLVSIAAKQEIPVRRSQAENREFRRASLLHAAIIAVAKYDIAGATVERICASAGAQQAEDCRLRLPTGLRREPRAGRRHHRYQEGKGFRELRVDLSNKIPSTMSAQKAHSEDTGSHFDIIFDKLVQQNFKSKISYPRLKINEILSNHQLEHEK